MTKPRRQLSINQKVFYPSLIFLAATIAFSLTDNVQFMQMANTANTWILVNFGWLFTWSAFLFLILLLLVYFSPLAHVTIGGKDAKPILSKWQWFSIASCTTVATGILFWGTAEPLYHLHQPPSGLQFAPNSLDSAHFAMSTMFMHWSFSPYGIYTITGLVFALSYYNLKQPFNISSLVFPALGEKISSSAGVVMDIICLSALVLGMAASLGTGIFALMGGLETTLNIKASDLILAIIGISIVGSFILSAISGLQKGIKILSNWNTKAFFVLALLLFLLGPSLSIFKTGMYGLGDYILNFLPRTNISTTG